MIVSDRFALTHFEIIHKGLVIRLSNATLDLEQFTITDII